MIQYIPIIGGLVDKWLTNRAKVKSYEHTEQMAVYNQFASEFRNLTNRTWWDSLIDGLNRLPRPVMTFGVIWLFYYAVSDPDGFALSAQALTAMPYEGWVALWMVIGFWFGTKAIEKMPQKFGKMEKIAPMAEPVRKDFSAAETDVQVGEPWNDKVKKRYSKTDWDDLNE